GNSCRDLSETTCKTEGTYEEPTLCATAEAAQPDRGADQHPEAWVFRDTDARQEIRSPRTGVGLGSVSAQSVDVRPDAEKEKEGRPPQGRLAAPEQPSRRRHTEGVSAELGN